MPNDVHPSVVTDDRRVGHFPNRSPYQLQASAHKTSYVVPGFFCGCPIARFSSVGLLTLRVSSAVAIAVHEKAKPFYSDL